MKFKNIFHWLVIGMVALAAGILIFVQYFITVVAWQNLSAAATITPSSLAFAYNRPKPPAIKVKGLYLTAYSASNPAKLNEIIKLIDDTELNAVVVDIKDYSGYVLYDSRLPFVNNNKLKSPRIKNLAALVNKLHAHGVYAIARVSTFQDPLLAETKPEWAIKSLSTGALWRDKKELAWVNPADRRVWKYVLTVAKEAASAGFDEINFDYIRFPTDGNLKDIAYTNLPLTRYQVIENFFKFVAREMADAPVYISADLFGLTTEKTGTDDMFIGQRLADAVKYFDYVCPMVYPSHYPSRYRDFSNPADHPYEVVYGAMTAGVKQAQGQRARLRSWIQAFNLGAIYDGEKIRAQIQASDDAGADGWILWNARNVYSDEGLLPE